MSDLGPGGTNFNAVMRKVNFMRRTPDATARVWRQSQIRLARAGNYELINPDAFSDTWPKPVIANFLNMAALDMAESLAPLPALNCSSGAMTSQRAKDRGSMRTKIAHYYWQHSMLKKFSVNAADWFFTMGFLPIVIEPDFEENCPRIRFEDPFDAFPEIDRYGKVHAYAKVQRLLASELAAMFPEAASRLLQDYSRRDRSNTFMEVIRYYDKDQVVMYVADSDPTGNYVPIPLMSTKVNLSRCPVVVAQRASLDGQWRGQYDDAIWVQMARAKMASLALEAGMKAVEAPIAVPEDMVEMPFGPDAIWRTANPQAIRRVTMEVPQSAFSMDQRLDMEAMRSTRYPEARSGNIQASVITGRGVQELMGSFDMLIKTAQDQFGEGLREATSVAFEMDEKYWGSMSKNIEGISAGAPYEITYRPDRDIDGAYDVEVTYGLAAGLAPNNAVVMMLQLMGAGLISKEAVQKQLPFDVDPIEMGQAITLEKGREAILAGIAGYAQAIPQMAGSGMDPSQPLQQIADFLTAVRKGTDIEAAALKAFTPPQPSPEDQAAAAQQGAGAGPAGPPGSGPPIPGGPPGAPPGGGMQMPPTPQAPPNLQSMVAQFRGGQASLGATTKQNTLT
jgi:hypothetical protein